MNMNESATLYFSTFSGVTDKGNPRTIPAPKRAGMSKQEATISTLRHRAQLHGDRYTATAAFLQAFSEITENRNRAQVNVNGRTQSAELVALAMGVDDTPTKRDALTTCCASFC